MTIGIPRDAQDRRFAWYGVSGSAVPPIRFDAFIQNDRVNNCPHTGSDCLPFPQSFPTRIERNNQMLGSGCADNSAWSGYSRRHDRIGTKPERHAGEVSPLQEPSKVRGEASLGSDLDFQATSGPPQPDRAVRSSRCEIEEMRDLAVAVCAIAPRVKHRPTARRLPPRRRLR